MEPCRSERETILGVIAGDGSGGLLESSLETFLDEVISPSAEDVHAAMGGARSLMSAVKKDEFVLETILFGSVGRNVCIRPIHDLDFGVMYDAKLVEEECQASSLKTFCQSGFSVALSTSWHLDLQPKS